ncbi:MAG TPA: TonB-dependent receptor [Candidatus Sulfomarinibacteraceae bacterium]|nr:TonB-dependent receptor [Candidatus Sulfomarinibacteraceae bacterium]
MKRRLMFTLCILVCAAAATVSAQTGEINGRVVYENAPLPGVTVTATSPALQGQRATVTNEQGDYIIKALPAGDYRIRFEVPAFTTLEVDVRISTNQPRTLDAVMYPDAVQEEIVVTGQYETVSTGSQGSETMEQSTLEKLPVPRTLNQAVLLAAGTSSTGPRNATSISGAQSYENLYTLNGVVMNENLRGTAFDMFIEDAVLETTTMTSNMSAEYGRFSGGVVNMVTKSGGNEFSGSFRTTVANESWDGKTPLTVDQEDTNNYTYEATFGGYLWRDRVWFFLAGRSMELSAADQIVSPASPENAVAFETTNPEDRYEGKLTFALSNRHRLMGSYLEIDETQTNYAFWRPADWAHVVPSRALPLQGISVTYNGVMTDNFFVEGLYSEREFTFEGGGGDDPSLGATPVWDYSRNIGFNAPAFCNASARPECTDEQRNNKNWFAKGSWFFNAAGTHDLVFGYDHFDDLRLVDNWSSATGYIYAPFAQQDYSEPGNPRVVIPTYGGWIIWATVLEESQGNSFVTDSVFVNDTWRLSDRWTVNFGLRYDKNTGDDASGLRVVDDSRVSPRLSASWDVLGDGSFILTGGANRYVMSVNQLADGGAAGGNPTWAGYLYGGPSIAAGTPEYPTNADALEAMFDWFFNVYGGPENQDLNYWIDYPGLTPVMGGGLNSPYGDEFTLGASLRLGDRGVVRADIVHREFGDFYASEIVPGRSVLIPNTDTLIDQATYVNYDAGLSREYDALQTRFDYRIGSRWSFGATYTYSKTEGNLDGENVSSGPIASQILEYADYFDPAWSYPVGSLGTDQRHKFRGWAVWDAIATTHHNLSFSVLQSFWSGTPYSAAGNVSTVPYVGDPQDLGYAGNPGFQTYYFSDRGAFTWDTITRTDVAINYSFFLNLGGTQLEVFVQPEVQNIFNESGVVGGETRVFDATSDPTLAAFNPFTETPVEGVHWRKDDAFGQPQDPADYQLPRTFSLSVGLRF